MINVVTMNLYFLCILIYDPYVFGLMGRAWDYLPMAMVILGRRLQVRASAVALERGGGCFSSSQATGKVFSTEHAIYSKFLIYLELVSVDYRPFASPSFEAASHVKNGHVGHYNW